MLALTLFPKRIHDTLRVWRRFGAVRGGPRLEMLYKSYEASTKTKAAVTHINVLDASG